MYDFARIRALFRASPHLESRFNVQGQESRQRVQVAAPDWAGGRTRTRPPETDRGPNDIAIFPSRDWSMKGDTIM